MKTPHWLPIAFACTSLLAANAQQQQPQIPPLPPGPLLNNAPDFAQWLVSITDEPVDITKNIAPKKFEERSLVRKTGPIRNQITITDGAPKTEEWFRNGWEAKTQPGIKDPIVILPHSNHFEGYYTDYSKGDFFGFDWISKKNYVGRMSVRGVDCIVFHSGPPPDPTVSSTTPAPASAATVSVSLTTGTSAFIDVNSRLPVLLKGDDSTTLYDFQPAPTTTLTLPPNIEAAFDVVKQTVARETVRPAAP